MFPRYGGDRSSRVVLSLIKECIDVCAKGGIRIEPVQGKDAVKLLDYKGPVKRALSLLILPIAIRNHHDYEASFIMKARCCFPGPFLDLIRSKLTS